jgi:hypothetical protein
VTNSSHGWWPLRGAALTSEERTVGYHYDL